MDRQNYVLQTFIGQGYYRQDACNDARFQCQDELRWRQSRGNTRGLRRTRMKEALRKIKNRYNANDKDPQIWE